MVKTLNTCILSSLVSNLFFYRQRMYLGQTKPRLLFMFIKVCREKKSFPVWSVLHFHC